MKGALRRPLAGLVTMTAIGGIVSFAAFDDGFADLATVTVLSPRAGLARLPH